MNFIGFHQIEEDSLCERIVAYFENSQDKGPGVVGNDHQVNTDIKDSTDLALDGPLYEEYGYYLTKCIEEYKLKYRYCDEGMQQWSIWPDINIQRYNPGQSYKFLHCERQTGWGYHSRRHLVFMTYLNDVDDGGETFFYYQDLKIKPKKGTTLIWPSDWTHTHCGIVSPTQTKYIVTGWISFEPHNQYWLVPLNLRIYPPSKEYLEKAPKFEVKSLLT
jgi:hypothetical protein